MSDHCTTVQQGTNFTFKIPNYQLFIVCWSGFRALPFPTVPITSYSVYLVLHALLKNFQHTINATCKTKQ